MLAAGCADLDHRDLDSDVGAHGGTKHLPPARAEAQLDGIYTQIERGDANANICFGFVVAAIQLAEKSRQHREKLLRQALHAAMVGVFELSLREMLAGRKPTVEILYRCGLGSLAAAAEQADPMAIVRSRMTSFRRLDVAA